MKTTYARVTKSENKFVVTELGMQIANVRSKYENDVKQYRRCVPQKWVDNGWVKEVENGEK